MAIHDVTKACTLFKTKSVIQINYIGVKRVAMNPCILNALLLYMWGVEIVKFQTPKYI